MTNVAFCSIWCYTANIAFYFLISKLPGIKTTAPGTVNDSRPPYNSNVQLQKDIAEKQNVYSTNCPLA